MPIDMGERNASVNNNHHPLKAGGREKR